MGKISISKLPFIPPKGFGKYLNVMGPYGKQGALTLIEDWKKRIEKTWGEDEEITHLVGLVAADAAAYGIKVVMDYLRNNKLLFVFDEPPDPRKEGWTVLFDWFKGAMVKEPEGNVLKPMTTKELAEKLSYSHDYIRQKKSLYDAEFGNG